MPGTILGTFHVLTWFLRDLSEATHFIFRDSEAEVKSPAHSRKAGEGGLPPL